MGKFSEYIGFQFGNPKGFVGQICCKIMNIINYKMYNTLISNITLEKNSKLLEIGYGNGHLIKKIYKKFKPQIYGIDISEDAKNLALNKNKNIPKENLVLEIGDCCNLTYSDNFFDSVVTINTIYFWEDTEKGLSEIFRTLKPKGSFYNIVYSKKWLEKLEYTKKSFKLFENDYFVKMGKSVGFKNVEIIEIEKEKSYIIVYKK